MSKKLSYILATRNKLVYMKPTLEKIIAHKQPDEEILVADGASTDGSKEYLMELKAAGKIDYMVSERDTGLAHALNKLVLAASGELIKYVTDDDAFDFGVIAECKKFMLEHPEIDLVNTEGGSLNDPSRVERETDPLEMVRAITYEDKYRVWQETHAPFFFCDLGVLYRKSSLPVIGFWNPIFPGPDIEFSLRVSRGRVKIAWYTGYGWVNISNPQSVSLVHMQRTKKLTERLATFYLEQNPTPLFLQKLRVLKNKLSMKKGSAPASQTPDFQSHWPKLITKAEEWMQFKNTQKTPEFLVPINPV